MTTVNKNKEIQKISKKINRLINNQSGKILTGVFEKITTKVDKKWELTPKIKSGLSNYFRKRLKEHTMLSYRKKQESYVKKLLDSKKDIYQDMDIDIKKRLAISKNLRNKTVATSSAQGGGAAVAGAPFTLLETFSMLNIVWEKTEIIALIFGIEPYSYFEKIYILYILSISLSENRENKVRVYKELMKLEKMINGKKISLLEQFEYIDIDILVNEISEIIISPLVSSKLTQTIPIVGVGFGTVTSGKTVQDILFLAQLLYTRRYIQN